MARDPFGGLESHHVPDHDGSASIAGFQFFHDEWQDVENGARPLEDYGDFAPQDVDSFTYHYINSHGDDVYFNITGPFETWEDFWEAIGDSLDRYGIA